MPNPLLALLGGIFVLVLIGLLFFPRGGLIGYFRHIHRQSNRVLMEDILKYVFNKERYSNPITIEGIAGSLQISLKQTVEIINQLKEKNLITFTDGSIHLTTEGQNYAIQMVRTHRLLERYFSERTGYDESEWHSKADELEHQFTPEEVKELSIRLGNPAYDPHGDPIPTSDGNLIAQTGKPLTKMPIYTRLRIVHLEDEPKTIYAQFIAEGLYPGMEIRITEKTPERIRFLGNNSEHVLAPIVAENINVLKVKEEKETIESGDPLSSLKPGESGEVIKLSPLLRHQERLRMMDLGILPGTNIKAELISPSGDPTAYRVRGSLIALRKEQAKHIRVKSVEKEG